MTAVLLGLIALLARRDDERSPTREPTAARVSVEVPSGADGGFEVTSSRAGAVPGARADAATVRAVRERLRDGGVEARCGPYVVWSDVGD